MIDGCETAQGLAWDDGVADLVIGSGFIVQPILWAIQFDAGSGAVIDAIHVALHDDGDIAVGDPITVHLWADPNNDGVPDDAVLLQSSVGTVQILGNGFDDDPEPYNVFPIEATRITGGFFVGAVTTTAQFPILGDEVPDPLIRGWGILSFDDPDAIQGAFPAFFGTYMVRAHAGLPCLCPADLDFDGEVGAGDLQLLLLAWGADPPGAADLDHNGVVDVRDLLALLAGWGACGSTP
jgi:hypothetical protein